MPQADLVMNSDLALKPLGDGDCCNTNCGCVGSNANSNTTTNGCACPPPPPYPYPYPPQGNWCPPPPPPYPCPPDSGCNCGPSCSSIEAQIAKLSKKSSTIRKMIDNLINKNKSIVITIGSGISYNFGTYCDKEGNETEYGKAVLEMLQTELEAIKAKIVELTNQLEVESDTLLGGVEETVTL